MTPTPAAAAIPRVLTAWLFGTALCQLDDGRLLNSFEKVAGLARRDEPGQAAGGAPALTADALPPAPQNQAD